MVVLYSGSGNGILRSCHCPNAPWGGPAKRAWLVDQIRQLAGRENVLVLDSGDLLALDSDEVGRQTMLAVYQGMQYDAVAIGDQDLPVLRKESKALPWLGGGYRQADGTFLAPPWIVRAVAGIDVSVIGIAAPTAFRYAGATTNGLTITKAEDVLASFRASRGDECILTILLSHQGEDADVALASRANGVDIIIGGHTQSLLNPPILTNGIAICQAGRNAENLGVLVLRQSPREAPRPAPTNDNPFAVSATRLRNWTLLQKLVPLDEHVDEAPVINALIDQCYDADDLRLERTMRMPATNAPVTGSLVIDNAVQTLRPVAGETVDVQVTLRNAGIQPLRIENVRSKSRWLTVSSWPTNLFPAASGDVRMTLMAKDIDRAFRCEFTVTSNDRRRPVAYGVIKGNVDGDLPWRMDVAALLMDMGVMTEPRTSGTINEVVHQSTVVTNSPRQSAETFGRTRIDLFYTPGCEECDDVKTNVLPNLVRRWGPQLDIRLHDVNETANYVKLVRLCKTLGVLDDAPVSLFVDEKVHFGGAKRIREDVPREVAWRVAIPPLLVPNVVQ